MFSQFLLICLIRWYLRDKKIYFKLDIFFKNKVFKLELKRFAFLSEQEQERETL